MSFCVLCGKRIKPQILSRKSECLVRGTRFEYDELYAVCPDCGNEVYTKETNDMNVERRILAFEVARSRGMSDAGT